MPMSAWAARPLAGGEPAVACQRPPSARTRRAALRGDRSPRLERLRQLASSSRSPTERPSTACPTRTSSGKPVAGFAAASFPLMCNVGPTARTVDACIEIVPCEMQAHVQAAGALARLPSEFRLGLRATVRSLHRIASVGSSGRHLPRSWRRGCLPAQGVVACSGGAAIGPAQPGVQADGPHRPALIDGWRGPPLNSTLGRTFTRKRELFGVIQRDIGGFDSNSGEGTYHNVGLRYCKVCLE